MTHRVSDTISDETLSRIIQIESAGNPKAKARTSSATGLAQFINSTWMATIRRHRPELLEGRTQAQVLALRTDPRLSIEMLARFTEENAAILPGVKDKDGDLYLAHFSGVGTAKRVLMQGAHTPAEHIFSKEAVRANRSILEGKTCGEVRAWAEAKMRKAGGKGWIDKFWVVHPTTEPELLAKPVPRDVNPEEEWTYENTKPETSSTAVASQGGFWATVMATLGLIWEKVQEVPESVLAVVLGLAQKPSFWFVIALGGVFAYIWWKRRQADKESAE